MLKRTISGLILAVVVIWAVDYSAASFYALWVAVGLLSLWEYHSLLGQRGGRLSHVGLWRWLGSLYIVGSLALLMSLGGGDEYFRLRVITIITLVWSNDVGAFLVGSRIGRHKMCPKISPKKSWEGFFGGVFFAILAGLAWQWVVWSRVDMPLELAFVDGWVFWGGMGLVAALAASGGDLIESKFKRLLGVKDSGNVIPGHGGMLDRFDALFLAAPCVWLYIYFMV